jgi:class 3 adenylate cyclase
MNEATAARILVVDDMPASLRLVCDRLARAGHSVQGVDSGAQALAAAVGWTPDLVLLDVVMPGMDGFEVCRALRRLPGFAAVPIVMLTSLEASDERVRALDAGADDFVSKPVVAAELLARVRSLLRVKALYDTVAQQREELARWSATLEQRVQQELARSERLSRLTRFFSPRLAARLVAETGDDPLRSHRGEVSVLFADLRGFTAFADAADPEQVMAMLARFHAAMGALILEAEGTLERFTGDGMMVFFNDPDPQPDHALRAVRLAVAMQAAMPPLLAQWPGLGGLAIGIARGPATLGAVGFRHRVDYAAIGPVTNRAARICAEARGGEILACEAVHADLAGRVACEPLPPLDLKGFARPVAAWRVTTSAAADAAAGSGAARP